MNQISKLHSLKTCSCLFLSKNNICWKYIGSFRSRLLQQYIKLIFCNLFSFSFSFDCDQGLRLAKIGLEEGLGPTERESSGPKYRKCQHVYFWFTHQWPCMVSFLVGYCVSVLCRPLCTPDQPLCTFSFVRCLSGQSTFPRSVGLLTYFIVRAGV